MKRSLSILATLLLTCIAAIALLITATDLPEVARAASPANALSITEISPNTASNDLNTTIVITGSGFAAVPTVTLGANVLDHVGWSSPQRLTATVPWGLITGTYTLTVTNPGGEVGALADAFTVTQGLGVWTTNGPYGGRIYELIIHPVTPTTVYAMMPWVGVFATYDSAEHWEPILGYEFFNGYLDMDATDPNELWAGGGHSLFHTVDGAVTWEISLGQDPPFNQCLIFHPVTHPKKSGVVYNAVWACPEQPSLAPDPSGIYSTTNRGQAWFTATTGLTDTQVYDIAIDPHRDPAGPDRVLAGTRAGNLFLSTDSGETWDWVARPSTNVERLYYNPYVPGEAWLVPKRGDGAPPPFLFKSTDPALQTWSPVEITGNLGEVDALEFTPGAVWAVAGGIYSSTNSGATWNVATGPGCAFGGDCLAIDLATPGRYYSGAGGAGVGRSDDGGQSCQLKSVGLTGIQPSAMAVPPGQPDTVYVKGELGLMWSYNGGHSWATHDPPILGGGFPGPNLLAVDPITTSRLYYGTGCGQGGNTIACLQIGEDPGPAWHEITSTLPTSPGLCSYASTVAAHPLVPGRILAGAVSWPCGVDKGVWGGDGGFYLSDDHGRSWSHVGPTQPISYVSQIAFDALDPDLIYAATLGTGLWRSTDGGETWALASPAPDAGVSYVGTHPWQTGRLLVASSTGDHGPGLYASLNRGDDWIWRGQGAGQPMIYAPSEPPVLYGQYASGEYYGLVRSTDDGVTWQQVPEAGPPQVFAAATDGERAVVYMGTMGGVSTVDGQALSADSVVPGRGSIKAGGIYRFTIVPGGGLVYLPLVWRSAP